MTGRRSFLKTLGGMAGLAGLASLGLAGLVLAACGRKPSHVDPPPGVEVDTFPRTYPTDDTSGPDADPNVTPDGGDPDADDDTRRSYPAY